MTSAQSPDEARSVFPEQRGVSDDTAAFQRFYLEGSTAAKPDHGLVYRLLVGWWRDGR